MLEAVAMFINTSRTSASRLAPRRHTARGSSLIEVLVTLVIIAIGMLGLAGLQLNSVRSANSSALRFEATLLADTILERMRANRPQAVMGLYAIDLGEDAAGGSLTGNDLTEWKARLATLPDGDGSIAMDGRMVTITIQWTNVDGNNAGGDDTSVLRVRSEL